MLKKISAKKILIFSSVILVLAVIFALTIPKLGADEPYYVLGPDLKVGKYYVDGDTSQYYLEVSDRHTIQLVGVDFTEYAMYGQDSTANLTDEEKAAFDEGIEELKQELSGEHEYLVADSFPDPENPSYMIYTKWAINNAGLLNGHGYSYIDENTIKGGTGEIFIYRDENSPATYSEPDKITRIVDAVWAK